MGTVQNTLEDGPLHVACRSGTIGDVEKLLKEGANPNSVGGAQRTPLFAAAVPKLSLDNQSVGKINVLVAHGADVLMTSALSCTPFSIACYEDRLEAACRLADLEEELRGQAMLQTCFGMKLPSARVAWMLARRGCITPTTPMDERLGSCRDLLRVKGLTEWRPNLHRTLPRTQRNQILAMLSLNGITNRTSLTRFEAMGLPSLPQEVLWIIFAALECWTDSGVVLLSDYVDRLRRPRQRASRADMLAKLASVLPAGDFDPATGLIRYEEEATETPEASG